MYDEGELTATIAVSLPQPVFADSEPRASTYIHKSIPGTWRQVECIAFQAYC